MKHSPSSASLSNGKRQTATTMTGEFIPISHQQDESECWLLTCCRMWVRIAACYLQFSLNVNRPRFVGLSFKTPFIDSSRILTHANLSNAGMQLVQNLSQRHKVSTDAITHMLIAVQNGNGSMAQFNHPDFWGMRTVDARRQGGRTLSLSRSSPKPPMATSTERHAIVAATGAQRLSTTCFPSPTSRRSRW